MKQNPACTQPSAVRPALLDQWNRCAARLDAVISHSAIALVNRLAIAAIFFLSGRTKVDGLLHVNESAYTLFREEYQLPVITPEVAAHLAAYAEHVFPLLLVLGLFTRLSALSLLVMTAVIQVFVYSDAWPTHLVWAGALIYLLARGAGNISADRIAGIA